MVVECGKVVDVGAKSWIYIINVVTLGDFKDKKKKDMIKSKIGRLLWAIVAVVCAGNAWAAQSTATFDFGTPQSISAMGLAVPTSTSKTDITIAITKGDVTLTPSTSPIPQVTYYQSAYDLYMFKNTAITLSVPEGASITDVTFTASKTSISATASTGTLSGLKWSGDANSVKFTATASNTIYTVTVTYNQGATVTGLGELKNVASGTDVRLYLPDALNCRVTYVSEDGAEAYLRDDSGAVMLDNVETNPRLQFNQHLAGWIEGTYINSNGLPKFVASDRTNSRMLVIANPVTEGDVAPVEVAASDLAAHAADWVTTRELRVSGNTATSGGNTVTINNMYGLGSESFYQKPYDGALVDITGLAVPSAGGKTLVPTCENGNRPVTYVINEDSAFIAPPASIGNARVRLARELAAGEYHTLALPFVLSGVDGKVLAPATQAGGKVTFATISQPTEAGKPYIVKPNVTLHGITATGVTLASGEPATVNGMTGMYNPTFMTGMVVKLESKGGAIALALAEASSIAASHAYFGGVTTVEVDGKTASLGIAGDVNGDGVVDIVDVNCIINVILGQESAEKYGGRADVDGNGEVDIVDVNAVINMILGTK